MTLYTIRGGKKGRKNDDKKEGAGKKEKKKIGSEWTLKGLIEKVNRGTPGRYISSLIEVLIFFVVAVLQYVTLCVY